jgi:hypothetical protein
MYANPPGPHPALALERLVWLLVNFAAHGKFFNFASGCRQGRASNGDSESRRQ